MIDGKRGFFDFLPKLYAYVKRSVSEEFQTIPDLKEKEKVNKRKRVQLPPEEVMCEHCPKQISSIVELQMHVKNEHTIAKSSQAKKTKETFQANSLEADPVVTEESPINLEEKVDSEKKPEHHEDGCFHRDGTGSEVNTRSNSNRK